MTSTGLKNSDSTTSARTRFIACGDLHAGSPAEGMCASQKLTEQAYPLLDGVVSRINTRAEAVQLDGAVFLGDAIEHSGSVHSPDERHDNDEMHLHRVYRKFDQLSVPHYSCIGNHDVMSLSEQRVAQIAGREHPYYACDLGQHRLIALCTNVVYKSTTEEHQSGSGIHVDPIQLAWLKRELAATDKSVVVVSHHPLSDQDLRGNRWFSEYPQCALTENRFEIQRVLAESGKVVLCLNGHAHWNYLTMDEFGTPHVTLQALIERMPDGMPASTLAEFVLKDRQFNAEIFGRDLALRSAGHSPQQIATDLADTYDGIAEVYDRMTRQWGGPELREYEGLRKMLPPNAPQVVCDFGCGPGRDVSYWSENGWRYIGVDVSRNFISMARQHHPDQRFINADFTKVDIEPNSASLVICNSSLQHIPETSLDAVLKQAFDTLQPGGLFYGHYRSGEGESLSISTEYQKPIARYIALYTQERMELALRRAGFIIERSTTFDHKYEGLKGECVTYKTRTTARKPGGRITPTTPQ